MSYEEVNGRKPQSGLWPPEVEQVREQVECIHVRPHSSGGLRKLHMDFGDGRICKGNTRYKDKTFMEKDPSCYPPEWGEWCKHCIREWRRGQ